jgi:L-alanine-DL-glutamate epimerase-like enolase superfamily enzyme
MSSSGPDVDRFLPEQLARAYSGAVLGGNSMKISRIVDLHADAGWRVFSFLKIETDAGLIGWSEYNESYGSKGLTVVIMKLAEMLIGQDPRPVELITANLYARTRQAPGGIIQQAIAAIENALVDVKAKALGVPVCEMLGGPIRDRLRLYWSHCGTYRLHHAEKMGLPPIRTLDDIRKLGEHVRERGFTALKTNIFLFDSGSPELYMPGFGRSPGGPELNPSVRVEEALDNQLAGFRDGTGKDVEFLLDLNFNFKTEGYIRLVRALERHRLMWSRSTASIRARSPSSVARSQRRWRAAKACSAVASSKISSRIMPWTSALSTCPGTASSSR